MIDDTTLAFADFRGNRQYISTGNVLDNETAAALMMELALFAYPGRSIAVPVTMPNAPVPAMPEVEGQPQQPTCSLAALK